MKLMKTVMTVLGKEKPSEPLFPSIQQIFIERLESARCLPGGNAGVNKSSRKSPACLELILQ